LIEIKGCEVKAVTVKVNAVDPDLSSAKTAEVAAIESEVSSF
jgi:hypothetical protein